MAWCSPAFYPSSQDLRAFKNANKAQTKSVFTHDDLYFGSNPFRPTLSHETLTPLFDIRETKEAYFLEGEFPGISDQKAIKLEWKGKRTLLVEATIPKLDLEAEWGIKLPKVTTPTDPRSRNSSVGAPLDGALADLKLHQAANGNHNESAITESPAASRAASRATSPQRPGPSPLLGVPHKDKKHRSSSFFSIKSEKPEKKAPKESPGYHDWSSERHAGVYRRTFCFPEDVSAETLQARLNQGLLKVMVKKAEPAKTTAVQIQFGE